MAHGSNERDTRIRRIDADARDVACVVEAQMLPRVSGVRRSVHAVAAREIRSPVRFPRADVDDVWIGRSHGDRANRLCGLLIEERRPDEPAVSGFPHTPARGAEVVRVRLAGYACDGQDATAAKRSDQAPGHGRRSGGRGRRRRLSPCDQPEACEEGRNEKEISCPFFHASHPAHRHGRLLRVR